MNVSKGETLKCFIAILASLMGRNLYAYAEHSQPLINIRNLRKIGVKKGRSQPGEAADRGTKGEGGG
jgi:hypothetical protein